MSVTNIHYHSWGEYCRGIAGIVISQSEKSQFLDDSYSMRWEIAIPQARNCRNRDFI